jgi:hypothetical protein
MRPPRAICLVLLKQDVAFAAAFAWAKTGNRMAARIAIIAITTKSSIRVKPLRFVVTMIETPYEGWG